MDANDTLVVEDSSHEDADLTDEESRDEREPCAVLHVPSQKGFTGADFKLFRGINKIGRSSEECTVCIPVQALSQQHACIEIRRATEVDLVYDLRSRNGTKRDKMRLEPEVRYELRHGDKLYLADLECRYNRVVAPAVRSKNPVSTSVAVSWQNPAGGKFDTSAECFSDSDESIDMLHMAEDMIEPQDSPSCLVADSATSSAAAGSPNGTREEEAGSVVDRTPDGGGGPPRRSGLRWQQSTPVRPTDREDDIFNMATQAYTMPVDCSVNETCNEADGAVGPDDSTAPLLHPDDCSDGAKPGSHIVAAATTDADTVPVMPAAAQSSQDTAPRGPCSREGDANGAGLHRTPEGLVVTTADDRGSDTSAYEAETQPYDAAVDPSIPEPASKAKSVQPALRRLASESDNESTLLISDVDDNDPQHLTDEPAEEDSPDVTLSEQCATTECKSVTSVTDAEEMIGAGMLGSSNNAPRLLAGSALSEDGRASNSSQLGLQPPPPDVVATAGRGGSDRNDRSPEQEGASSRQSSGAGSRKRRSCIPLPSPESTMKRRRRGGCLPQPVQQAGGSAAAAEGDYVASSSLEGRGADDDDDDEGDDGGDGQTAASIERGATTGSAVSTEWNDGSGSAKGAVAAVASAADADTLPYVDDSIDTGGSGSPVATSAAADDLASSPILPAPVPSGGSCPSEKSAMSCLLPVTGGGAPAAAAGQELPTQHRRRAAAVRHVCATAVASEAPVLPVAAGDPMPPDAGTGRVKGAKGARGKRSVAADDAAVLGSDSASAEQPAAASSRHSAAGRLAAGARRSGAAAAAAADKPVTDKRGSSSSSSGVTDVPATKRSRTSLGRAIRGRAAAVGTGSGGSSSGDGIAGAGAQPATVAQTAHDAAGRSSALAGGAVDKPCHTDVDMPGRAARGRRSGAPASVPVAVDHGDGRPSDGIATTSVAPGCPGKAVGARGRRSAGSASSVSRKRFHHDVDDGGAAAAAAAAVSQGRRLEADAESSEAADVGEAPQVAEASAATGGLPSRGRRRPAAAVVTGGRSAMPAAASAPAAALASGGDEKKPINRMAQAGCPATAEPTVAAATVTARRRRESGGGGSRSGGGVIGAAASAAAHVDPNDDGSARRSVSAGLTSPPASVAADVAPGGKRPARGRKSQSAVADEKVDADTSVSHPSRAVKGESSVPPAAAAAAGEPLLSREEEEEEEEAKPAGRQGKRHTKQAAEVSPTESPLSAQAALALRISKPKIMFTGISDSDYQEIIKRLGGSLVDSVSQCTHLVTDEVRRTLKFLCCVTRGIPIVTPQWLAESSKASSFLDATKFLLRDKAKEKLYGFSLPESLERARSAPLLKDYKVHATKSVKPPPEQIKDVVTLAGGTYMKALPKPGCQAPQTIVISCPEDVALCKVAAAATGIAVVTAEFLLTGVLQQKVDVNSYALSC